MVDEIQYSSFDVEVLNFLYVVFKSFVFRPLR